MQSEMEPVHVHAPLPMPSPLNFQQALEMWGRARDDSEIKVEHEDTHEGLISPSVESHTDQATPHIGSTFGSRLDEYTQSKVIVQTQMLRSKLSFFRMLLACATLNREQRFALHQFATELQSTMDVVLAKGAAYDEASGYAAAVYDDAAEYDEAVYDDAAEYDEAVAYDEAAAYSQASPSSSSSEEHIANIPPESLAESASTLSWDGDLSLSSEYNAEPVTFSGETAPFDFVAPSFAPPALYTNPQAYQGSTYPNETAIPPYDQDMLRSPINLSSMPAGPSHVQLSAQAHVSTSIYETASNSEISIQSSTQFTLHNFSPHGNLQWTNPPPCHSGASDRGVVPWSRDVYPPVTSYEHTLCSVAATGLSSLYNPDIPSSVHQVQYANDGMIPRTFRDTETASTTLYAGQWSQMREPQAQIPDDIARLQYNVGPPSDWSSSMSECSCVA